MAHLLSDKLVQINGTDYIAARRLLYMMEVGVEMHMGHLVSLGGWPLQ